MSKEQGRLAVFRPALRIERNLESRMLIQWMLFSVPSQASSFEKPFLDYEVKDVVTPFGVFSDRVVQSFCRMPNVVIGTVQSVTSYNEPGSSNRAPTIASHTYLAVEATLLAKAAPVPPILHLVLSGGRVGNRVQPSPEGRMIPKIGVRYVIGYLPRKERVGQMNVGDPAVGAFVYVNPKVELDPPALQQQYQEMRDANCGPKK